MAIVTNSRTTGDSSAKRESLYNVVSRITPEDTPIYSMIGKTSCSQPHHEWFTSDLLAPSVPATGRLEGDELGVDRVNMAERYGAYSEIFKRTGSITASQEKARTVGGVDHIREKKLDASKALLKDVELSIVLNRSSAGGQNRRSAGLRAWLSTNTNTGTGGADKGWGFGDDGNAATGMVGKATDASDSNRRDLTENILDELLRSAFIQGGNPTFLVCSAYVKEVIAGFHAKTGTSIIPLRQSTNTGAGVNFMNTVDMYTGPNGAVSVVPNRVMGAGTDAATMKASSRNAYLIDKSLLKWTWYRRPHDVGERPKTHDSTEFAILAEGMLTPLNEKAHAVAADLLGISSDNTK